MFKERKKFMPSRLLSRHAAGSLGGFSPVSTTADMQFCCLGLRNIHLALPAHFNSSSPHLSHRLVEHKQDYSPWFVLEEIMWVGFHHQLMAAKLLFPTVSSFTLSVCQSFMESGWERPAGSNLGVKGKEYFNKSWSYSSAIAMLWDPTSCRVH